MNIEDKVQVFLEPVSDSFMTYAAEEHVVMSFAWNESVRTMTIKHY